MKKFKDFSLKEYLEVLSLKQPTPGGGSAAALAGALGVALLTMAANYSKGRSPDRQVNKKIAQIIQELKKIRLELLRLIDKDAEAYLKVVAARKKSAQAKTKAAIEAREVSLNVCRRCYKAVQFAPYLVKHGNQYLVSDVEVGVEILLAGFNGALIISREQ